MTIASSPAAATMRNDSSAPASRGAAPIAISLTAVESDSGTARSVAGVGTIHRSAVSRKNTNVSTPAHAASSSRLTATAASR